MILKGQRIERSPFADYDDRESFWMSLSDELFIQVRPLGGFPNVRAALLIRRQIFQHLDLIDLVHVSQTCVRWRNIAHDNILWHASDFDSLANADADVSSGAPCMRRPSSLSAARPTIGGTCTYSDTYTAIRYSLFFSLVPFFFLRKDREREKAKILNWAAVAAIVELGPAATATAPHSHQPP